MQTKTKCDKCQDTGFIPYNKGSYSYARYCDCKTLEYNLITLQRVLEKIPVMVRENLSYRIESGEYRFFDFIPNQNQIKMEKDIVKNRLWISGPSHAGKTHILAERLIQIAKRAKKVLSIDWVEAKEFDQLLLLQYSDNAEYERRKKVMRNLDILFLNDFDKIGKDQNLKYSVFKSNELKDFTDNVFSGIKVFDITANSTMAEFFQTFTDASVAMTIWSRFKDKESLAIEEIKV